MDMLNIIIFSVYALSINFLISKSKKSDSPLLWNILIVMEAVIFIAYLQLK